MCVIGRNRVKIAKKDIKVFKVLLKSGSPIFRNDKGIDPYDTGEYKADFNDMIKKDAIGFDKGFGFTVFRSKTNASYYLLRVKQVYSYFGLELIVREYKIPKGSRYKEGNIKMGLIGYGLLAIRCERLKE